MREIIIFTDYLDRFGSKQNSESYRSGMKLDHLKSEFENQGFRVFVYQISNFDKSKINLKDAYILFTSTEDINGKYKSFISDIVYFFQLSNYSIIPNYAILKSHNNKVMMELLRMKHDFDDVHFFDTKFASTINELKKLKLEFPVVIKGASGALSKGVYLANNRKELISFYNKIHLKDRFFVRLKEWGRRLKHRGNYNYESLRRGKVLVQKFIPNVNHDYKVLIYFDKCFVLKRNNRKNDFRASGSGDYEYIEDISVEILNLALHLRKKLSVPNLSIDIAETNKGLCVFEFQGIYFGTKTIESSPFHFILEENGNWKIIKEKVDLEKTFVYSVSKFINS